MDLELNVPGADVAQTMRGLEAARLTFAAAGISADTAARGAWARDRWEVSLRSGSRQPTDSELVAARVFDEAEAAAIGACCAGWAEVPSGAGLRVRLQSSTGRGEGA